VVVTARGAEELRMRERKPTTTRPRSLKKPIEADLGFDWGTSNNLLLGVGLLALVVGYVALSKGSTTFAPVLLVAGYCGFIPASLLVRRRAQGSGE
jgi:hypothetical protein